MDLNFVAIGGVGWELFDYGMNSMPANAYTDAAVYVIKGMQNSDGYLVVQRISEGQLPEV